MERSAPADAVVVAGDVFVAALKFAMTTIKTFHAVALESCREVLANTSVAVNSVAIITYKNTSRCYR